MVAGREAAEGAEGGVAALGDDAAHGDGEVPIDGLALGHVGEARQGVLGVGVAEEDLALAGEVPAEDGAQEGGLPGAVGTEDGGGRAAGDIHGHAVEGDGAAVAYRDVTEAQDMMGGGQARKRCGGRATGDRTAFRVSGRGRSGRDRGGRARSRG